MNRLSTTAVRAASRLVPAVAPPAERHLPRFGIVHAPLPNGRLLALESAGDEPWSNRLFWRGWDGFYEPETLPVFFSLAGRARVTFDIGANVGIFSLLAGHANPGARVHAFEPDQRAFGRLVRHVELNGLPNVESHCTAVADTDGDMTLHAATAARPEDAVAVSAQTSVARAHVEAEGSRIHHIEEQRAPAVSVDGFVDAHDIATVDLVKIDVEGAEPLVVAGMTETIRRHRPDIVCEVLDTETGEAIETALGRRGYSWRQLTWAGPVARDHIGPVGGGVWPNWLITCTD